MQKTIDEIEAIVSQCQHPGFTFRVYCNPDAEHISVRVGNSEWRGRAWSLSIYMTDGEIVQTCLLALLTFLEHETREHFTYKGQSIFDPHYDIDKLVALRAQPEATKGRDQ